MNQGLMTFLEALELIRDPHVIATPSTAFYSKEEQGQILTTTAETILAFGRELRRTS